MASTESKPVQLRIPIDVLEKFQDAAARNGLSLSTWLIVLGLQALGESDLVEQLGRVEDQRRRPRSR